MEADGFFALKMEENNKSVRKHSHLSIIPQPEMKNLPPGKLEEKLLLVEVRNGGCLMRSFPPVREKG